MRVLELSVSRYALIIDAGNGLALMLGIIKNFYQSVADLLTDLSVFEEVIYLIVA